MVVVGGVDTITEVAQLYRRYYLVAYWLEALIYGAYALFFVLAINLMKRREVLAGHSAKFLLAGITLMFGLITINNLGSIHRLLKVYAISPHVPTPPMPYESDRLVTAPVAWDTYLPICVLILISWITDAVMIYRCYMIYEDSIVAILLPSTLFTVCIGIGIYTLYWYQHPIYARGPAPSTVLRAYLPLSLAGNLYTTCVVTYRIWSKSRAQLELDGEYRRDGILSMLCGGRKYAVPRSVVGTIVIESAFFWTIQVLIIAALFYLDHPALVIVNHAIVPTSGIVFIIIALRIVHGVPWETVSPERRDTSFTIPSWLEYSPDEESPEQTTASVLPSSRPQPLLAVSAVIPRRSIALGSERRESLGQVSSSHGNNLIDIEDITSSYGEIEVDEWRIGKKKFPEAIELKLRTRRVVGEGRSCETGNEGTSASMHI